MASKDPYYLVRDDIQASLDKVQSIFATWQGMSKNTAQATNLMHDIEEECSSIQWQVDEISKAVDVAERNMARFNLSQAEIVNRRKWVHSSQKQVATMLTAVEAAKEIAAKRGAAAEYGAGGATSKLGDAVRQENDEFIASQSDQQALLMRQQDDELDELGEHVSRIGRMGKNIHDELQHQTVLLDGLEEDLEGTQNRLAAAQRKVNSVLQKAGAKGQLCIIVSLLVLLVILIYIAFS